MCLIVLVNRKACKFGGLFFCKSKKSGAGDYHAVPFDYGEIIYIQFQLFARARHQHATGFQRLDQLQYAADILDGGVAGGLVVVIGIEHQADAVAGVELAQQHAIGILADQMNAFDAAATGTEGGMQDAAVLR